MPKCPQTGGATIADDPTSNILEGRGSIIVVVATDAPLLPHQLERISRRVSMALGRLGSWASNSSGDLFLAFSTANPGAANPDGTRHHRRHGRSCGQRDARSAATLRKYNRMK